MKRWVWRLLLVTLCIVFVWSLYHIISELLIYKEAENEYDTLFEAVIQTKLSVEELPETNTATPSQKPVVGASSADIKTDDDIPEKRVIDYDLLYKTNPDFIGWLSIEGMLEYPIVQTGDNETYLYKTFSGTYNKAGTIFMDSRCSRDFSSLHTIIYGHKLWDGTMFSELLSFKDQAFYEEHSIMIIYTPDAVYTCEIFSAYVDITSSDSYILDFSNENEYASFIRYITGKSLISTDVTVSTADRVITLSTCTNGSANSRMLVHAKITNIELNG